MDHSDDDISLPDEIEAFPIIMSELEETMQTIDPDQLPAEQDASRLTPLSILTADTIGALHSRNLLKVLIHRRALPPWHCQPKDAKKINTINGANTCSDMVILCNIHLPEFDKSQRVKEQKAMVYDYETRYDLILGTDFLTKTGIDIKYSSKTMQWFENELPMQDPMCMDNKEFLAMVDVVKQQCIEELYGMDLCDPTCYAIKILDVKYDTVSIKDVVKECMHLKEEQRADLQMGLSKFQKLFSGKLEYFPIENFTLSLSLEQGQSMYAHMQYPVFIWLHSRRN